MRNGRQEQKKRIRLMDLLRLDDEQINKALEGKSIESFITSTLKKAVGKPTKPINIIALDGKQWLRLMTEMNLASYATWCEGCRAPYQIRVEGEEILQNCPMCGGTLLPLGEGFWRKISEKVRMSVRKDRSLIPKVKAEWESLWQGIQNKPQQQPQFPASLSWLNDQWEKARRPVGGPSLNVQRRYGIANWYQDFKELGLTNGEIIDVMSGTDFPDGPFKIGKRDYANIPGQDLRKLGECFKQSLGTVSDPVELYRIRRWVYRQRKKPMARLRGERVRGKGKNPK
jgi:hypothetical protein